MKKIRGQSMFEVILSLAVIALIIVGVVILATNSIRNSTFSKNKTLASRYTQEAIEWLRDERNLNPDIFLQRVITSTNYCLDSLGWSNIGLCTSNELISGTVFKRDLQFSSSTTTNIRGETVDIITASIEISWSDAQGEHITKSSTEFLDFR